MSMRQSLRTLASLLAMTALAGCALAGCAVDVAEPGDELAGSGAALEREGNTPTTTSVDPTSGESNGPTPDPWKLPTVTDLSIAPGDVDPSASGEQGPTPDPWNPSPDPRDEDSASDHTTTNTVVKRAN
jgi:hypothetical protein